MLKKETPPSSEEIARRFDEAAFEGVDLSGLKRDLAEPAQEENLSEYLRQKEAEEMKPGGDLPPSRVPGVKHTSLDRKIMQAKIDKKKKADKVSPTVKVDRKTEPKPVEAIATSPVVPKPDAEPVVPNLEDIAPEKTIEDLRADLDAKRLVYAQLDLDKSRKWARLKNLLGAGIKEVKDEDFDRAWGEYEEAKRNYFEIKRGNILAKGNKEEAREFLLEFEGVDEAVNFLNLKYDLKKNQSGYPAKILYGFEKLANGWKDMSWKKKLAVSAAIFGVGALAGITGGASFGLIGATAFTLRTVQRTLGAGAMYIGAKRWQDKRSLGKMTKERESEIKAFLESDDWLEKISRIEYGLMSDRSKFSKEKVEALDKKHKRRALILAAGIGIGGTAFDMYRQGYFGGISRAVKEKIFGIGGGLAKPSVSDHIPEVAKPSAVQPSSEAYYAHGPDRKITGLTPQGDEHFKQFNIEPHDSPKPEIKTGGSAQAWAETTRAAGAKVQVSEIAKPKFEDIPVKIKAGGNMWASIESKIKANPSAYGLDQTDPNFKTNMNGKIAGMLHDFADKNGLSYKQLDKVFEGDNFKIGHDATGKPYLYDFHGKAFGADVSPGGAGAAQEIASNKPKIAVEDAKPKASVAPEDTTRPGAGAAAEQQPTRARGGQVNAAQEVVPQQKIAQDYQSKLAQANQELAARHPEEFAANARETAMANNRIFLSTRGLWNSVFEGAGFSRHGNVWNSSALEVYNQVTRDLYIADDVSLSEATDRLNENMVRIGSLFKKFGKPLAGMSMGEYFRNITSNSRNIKETIEFINTFRSAPYEELIKPLRK